MSFVRLTFSASLTTPWKPLRLARRPRVPVTKWPQKSLTKLKVVPSTTWCRRWTAGCQSMVDLIWAPRTLNGIRVSIARITAGLMVAIKVLTRPRALKSPMRTWSVKYKALCTGARWHRQPKTEPSCSVDSLNLCSSGNRRVMTGRLSRRTRASLSPTRSILRTTYLLRTPQNL